MNRTSCSRLAAISLLALLVAAAASGAPTTDVRLELKGRVLGERGKPLPGATVGIYTAGPRVGIGSACPSCYPECRKQTVTDAKGRFSLPGLSDQLLYNLLIIANGYFAQFVDHVDPRAAPVEATLHVRDTVLSAGLRTLVGHVVDPHGDPVVGASVEPVGIHRLMKDGPFAGQPSIMYGDLAHVNARIDPLAISDANGEFRLTGPDTVTAWVLQVTARGLSPGVFPEVANTGAPQLLELESGATVIGAVLREGRPVPGAVIGITQVDRKATNAVPPDTIAADENGRFTFANVPAGQDYAFSGIIESLRPWALRTVVRTVGENDSVTTLPPLSLEPGHRLGGRVVLSDGKRVLLGTQLTLGRSLAGNPVQVPMDSTGHFELTGLPPETIELRIRMKGYRIAAATRWYQGGPMGAVRIPILRDYDDVEIVLEPTPPVNAPATARP
jgi:hypothetical protein